MVQAANSHFTALFSVVATETKNLRQFIYRRRLVQLDHWNLEPVLKTGAGDLLPTRSREPVACATGNQFSNTLLLRTLINPCADQADLFLGQRGILIALVRGGHFHILHQLGDVSDQWALGAVPGEDGGVAALAAFNHRRATVHPVFALRLLAAVAFDAGLLEQRLDVLLEGQALLVRSGRQLACVPFRLFLVLSGAQESERGQAKRGRNERPNVSAEALGQATGFRGSIIHGRHFNQRRQRRQKDSFEFSSPCPCHTRLEFSVASALKSPTG